jgi:hypothetical protein
MPDPAASLEKILWTCLPNGMVKGAAGTKLRVAVMVSPRLGSNSLGVFANWPAILLAPPPNNLSFAIEIKNGPALPGKIFTSVPATRVDLDLSTVLDPGLWGKIFTSATSVTPQSPGPPSQLALYSANIQQKGIQSYSVRDVASYIKTAHLDLEPSAAHQLPPTTTAHSTFFERLTNELGPIATNSAGVLDLLFTPIKNNQAVVGKSGGGARETFKRFLAYRTRALSKDPTKQKFKQPPPPKPSKPDMDFHQIISSFGDYPLILRRLGLIIDLEIPLPTAAPKDSQLRLHISGGSLPAQDPQPCTAYLLTDDAFVAKPRASAGLGSLHDGVIDLGGVDDSHASNAPNSFEIVQIDPDATGAKMLHLTAALIRRDLPGPIGGGRIGLAALRSAGLSLIKHGRASDIANSITNAAKWDGSQVFFAEDLLRGYRVDVLDETEGSTWRSLCQRAGTYTLNDGSVLQNVPHDEGYVKVASTTSEYASSPKSADLTKPLYLHESIFRWAGWGLCVRRPGKTITDEGAADPTSNAGVTGLGAEFQAVTGTLPRLRFGHSYKLRLRAVDLAGGGLKLTDPDPPMFVSNSVVYARFDPIPPPVVVPTADLGEGESVDRLVIRSNSYFAPTTATSDRHLAPPKSALQMVEAHGALDKFMGASASDAMCDAGYNLALREAGSLLDSTIVDITTGQASIQVQGVKVIKVGLDGKTAIHTEPQMQTPYLPDPIARGVTLSGVPNAGGVTSQTLPANVAQSWGGTVPQGAADLVILKVPFSGSWPDVQPFRLRIAERPGTVPANTNTSSTNPADYDEVFSDTGQPTWDSADSVLTVFLGKGQRAHVRYSSYPDLPDVLAQQTPTPVPQLGFLHWWSKPNDPGKTPTPAQVTAMAKFIAAGANWQVTPFRELVLVHAVQQPLCAPVMAPARRGAVQLPMVQAELGNASVTLVFRAIFNALTTGNLDLFATWLEPTDDPAIAPNEPKQIARSAQLRLKEPPPPEPGAIASNVQIYTQQQHFGDTKYRSIDYFLRATTVFREYFPPEITADQKNITRDGPKFTLKVPNRARPAAPKMLYVIPTFGWDPPRSSRKPLAPGQNLSFRRIGGSLRVYLDRPWYSSGDGELLGIVVRSGGGGLSGDTDPMKNVITTWGVDPISLDSVAPSSSAPSTKLVGQGLAVENFSGQQQVGRNLVLAEQPAQAQATGWTNVDVIGYAVQFDAEQRRWYADVQIDPGQSYCPFIRLALARYQPDSVAGAELSPVVLCDFMQLLPHRTLSVTASADGKTLQVRVDGVMPRILIPPRSQGSVTEFLFDVQQISANEFLSATDMRYYVHPDAVWVDVSRTITVGQPGTAGGVQILQGRVGSPSATITMPEPIGSGKYRLVVRENDAQGINYRALYVDTLDM